MSLICCFVVFEFEVDFFFYLIENFFLSSYGFYLYINAFNCFNEQNKRFSNYFSLYLIFFLSSLCFYLYINVKQLKRRDLSPRVSSIGWDHAS
jgi:hypothetical protein